MGMVKVSEPVMTDRNPKRAKETDRLGPKGEVVGRAENGNPSRSLCYPVDSRHLTPQVLVKRNVGTSFIRPLGRQTARGAVG